MTRYASDASDIAFYVMGHPEPSMEYQKPVQKTIDGLLVNKCLYAAVQSGRPSVISIQVPGDIPDLEPGMRVELEDFVISIFESSQIFVSYWAKAIRPATVSRVVRNSAGGEA
jgi:hypothetical protein